MTSFVYIPKALCYYVVRLTSLTRTASMKDAVALYRIAVRRYDKFSRIYDGVSLRSVINFANNVIKLSGEKSDDMDTAPFERVIKDNIGQILFGKDYPFNIKKRSLAIYLGLTRPKKA
jgi:hypothetical protein